MFNPCDICNDPKELLTQPSDLWLLGVKDIQDRLIEYFEIAFFKKL